MHALHTRQDGTTVNIALVPATGSDINRLRDHSARGGANALSTYCVDRGTHERLTTPLLRIGGALTPVSWEEALTVLSGVIQGVRDQYGPDDLCAKAFDHGGGGGGFENNYAVGKLFFTGLGMKMVSIHNRPAYNSEVWGSRDRGVHELHYCAEDVRLCDTLVLWGANSFETATVLFTEHILPNFTGGNTAEKQAILGASEPIEPTRVVVVDPRRNATVKYLQSIDDSRVLHLRPQLGTDVVLADTLARVIWERGMHDTKFVSKRTDAATFSEYRAKSLREGTALDIVLADAERITGIPRADIEKAAAWMAVLKGKARRRTLTLYEKGVIWNQRNYDTVAAVVQLSALAGNIGRPGTGCGRQGGHQEGYVRPGYPGVRPPPNVDQYLIDGKGRFYWVLGTNPYLSTPRAQVVRAAVSRRAGALTHALQARLEPTEPEARAAAIVDALNQDGLFLVVSELYLTETAQDAHLVLPAAGWGEMNLTSINCNSRLLRLYARFADPPGDALPDWDIMARAARKIGERYKAAGRTQEAARFEGFNWKTDEDVFLAGASEFPDNHVDEVGAESLPCETYAGVTYEYLRNVGQTGIQTPVRRDAKTGELSGTKRRYTHRFATPNGRFSWHGSDAWSGFPSEIARYLEGDLAKTHPFWLTTGRTQRLWQTGYHDQHLPARMAEVPLPFIEIHPDDAHTLGVSTGDLVEAYNKEGHAILQVRVDDASPVGTLFALQYHPLGTANALTSGYTDPKTTIPWYKGTRVGLRRLIGDITNARATTTQQALSDLL
jgi:arsenite oxidase large subunit